MEVSGFLHRPGVISKMKEIGTIVGSASNCTVLKPLGKISVMIFNHEFSEKQRKQSFTCSSGRNRINTCFWKKAGS